jgi:serine/threonine protein kinase/beta-lactam-binding protein with PASTA domain
MIGKRLNGRYQILSRIGDGGMAVVYKAKDLILDRLCAVKVLRQEFSNDEAFIRRFRREAEAVASLSHPNIVNIYDIGDESDLYYIVMEYVDGVTLKAYIKEFAPVPPENSVYILKQIASAIEHAHQHGIVHRDIKPQNILIDENDRVKVTDFGIALATTGATITYTNSIIGSAHYLSPEQAKGSVATIKSDIYAFGIVMYEMLTGQLPFPGESPVTVALKHLSEPYVLPRDINPSIPQSLENIIIRALAKNPEDRYDTIGDVYDDLSTALDPSRIDEPRIQLLDDHDADATRIIPPADDAEKSQLIGTGAPVAPQAAVDDGKEAEKPKKEPKNKNKNKGGKNGKKKKRVLTAVIAALIIAILAVAGIFVLPKFFAADHVKVPILKGKTLDQALELLDDHQLKAKKKNVTDEHAPKGIVVDQNPKAGKEVSPGSTVTIYVSKGPKEEEVPDYVGYSKDAVEQLLKDNKYKDVIWKGVPSTDVPEGQIISQKPEAGKQIVPQETVLELTYSTGPETAEVPDLTGLSKDDAESRLKAAGFDVTFADGGYSDNVEKDHVMKTDPSPGTALAVGKTVTVYLSKGPKAQAKTTIQNITVAVDGGDGGDKPDKDGVHVQIYFSDMNNEQKLFADETIKKTKTYNLPLTIAPGGSARYQVYVDGQLVRQETIRYDDLDGVD